MTMTINPRDYDLDELREMARERGEANGQSADGQGDASGDEMPGGFKPLAGASEADELQSDLFRELMPLEAADQDLEKPYLETLPESYAAEHLIFEWLEFMLDRFGFQGTTEAIGYYESVGWLTEDVKTTLNDYLLGIEDQHEGAAEGTIDDHKLSLVYLAKLVSME